MIKEFNKPSLRKLREALESNMKKLGDELGLIIEVGRIGYSATNVTMKLEANIIGADNKEEKAYNDMRELYPDLPELGTVVRIYGKAYIIVGWNARARKYPIIGERGGNRYKLEEAQVIKAAKLNK